VKPDEVIKRLCAMATDVGGRVFGYNAATDCFCGEAHVFYEFDERVLRFIEAAVAEASERVHRLNALYNMCDTWLSGRVRSNAVYDLIIDAGLVLIPDLAEKLSEVIGYSEECFDKDRGSFYFDANHSDQIVELVQSMVRKMMLGSMP
jgi:hypothetical protein